MAVPIFTDVSLVVNAVNLSDHLKNCTLTYEAEILDSTVMTTSGTRANRPGLKNWSVEAEFLQDYDAASIDATLFALIGDPAVDLVMKPTSALVGPANPSFSGTGVLESYPPITGEVGALGTCSCTFRCASPLIRAVA